LSEDNVQLRTAYEALDRKDLDTLVGLLHPDVEFRNPDYAMEPGIRHGHDGFRRAMEAGFEAFDDVRYEIDGIVEGDDVIVVTGRFRGRGRGGGVPVDAPFAHVFEIRDDKATTVSWFQDADEALRAAGLQAAPTDRP
jgi:ketosteroid isomerase-like protein